MLYAVGDDIPMREVVEVFAAHLNIPAVSVAAEQVGDYVGWLGGFWGTDGPASSRSLAICADGSRPGQG